MWCRVVACTGKAHSRSSLIGNKGREKMFDEEVEDIKQFSPHETPKDSI